jgi:hypothetical protein
LPAGGSMLSVRAVRAVFLVAVAWFYFWPSASPYGNGHTLAQSTNLAHRNGRMKPVSAIPRRLMFVAVNGFLTKGDLDAASASGLHLAAALNVQRTVRMHRNVSHKMYTDADCLEVLQEQKRHAMWKTVAQRLRPTRLQHAPPALDQAQGSLQPRPASANWQDLSQLARRVLACFPHRRHVLLHAFRHEKYAPFKSDICRAAALFKEGGFYLDNDIAPEVNVV